jgi:ATP-dependent protease ClpP protease subunit
MSTQQAVQLPLEQQSKTPAFISFSADINPSTTEILLGTIAKLVGDGFTDINLLLSTPGGSVSHGIAIYNFLRGLPIKLTTHNIGNVDSIGSVVFLAGELRYSCPQSTFMLHGVAFGTTGASQFFEKNLVERLASVRADQERIKAIYTERANLTETDAERYFISEATLNADEAQARGLIHEIRQVSIPTGSPILQLVFNR